MSLPETAPHGGWFGYVYCGARDLGEVIGGGVLGHDGLRLGVVEPGSGTARPAALVRVLEPEG